MYKKAFYVIFIQNITQIDIVEGINYKLMKSRVNQSQSNLDFTPREPFFCIMLKIVHKKMRNWQEIMYVDR